MKNPLSRRHLRELKGDFGKYLVIFLLLLLMISEVSGYLVADESMIAAYNESFTKYNVEDGNFTSEKKLNRGQLSRIEKSGVSVYELFFTEKELSVDATLRLFPVRDEVNLACLMEGALPERKGEVAIDRLFARNIGAAVGDTLQSGDETWTITGLIALSDYSTMFSDNDDTMFDSLKFGVGVVASEEFATYAKDALTWRYAWKYDVPPANEREENERSEAFLKELAREVHLTDYIPRYQNQAIMFTGEDMGGDRQMMQIFLYIVIVIIAFVFAVTISNTIAKEANVIGTLRASGYTKGELLRHYMFLPIVVTIVAAAIGNVLGYTALKYLNAWLYYNSYSLPTYETRWNASAFVQTTIVPIAIMLIVDVLILSRKLSLSPLKFLRRDLSRSRRARAVSLSPRIPFFTRFRARVIMQNMSNYVLLFFGVVFANLLLMFGLLLPSVLKHYQDSLPDNLLCNYQYILQLPAGAVDEDEKIQSLLSLMMFERAVETENEDAEKFSAYSLRTVPDGDYKEEEILLYGVRENSRYVPIAFPKDDGVFVSDVYADKYGLNVGDTVVLQEAYKDETYTFRIDGIYGYTGGLCMFMKQSFLNETFALGKDTFTGYLSDTPITDIDEAYLGRVIDIDVLTQISRQLDVSMGSMMNVVDAFSVAMFMILIYLLSKIIIEKNAQSISMTKILGYTNAEISGLYILSTTIMTLLFILLSLPIGREIIAYLWRTMIIQKMSGWIPFYVGRDIYLTMIALGVATYAIVAFLEYRKIRRVPMDEALKTVE